MRSADEINDIAYEVRGCGIDVHRALGPGCFECAYTPCFAYELQRRKLGFRTKAPLTLRYHEVVIERAYEADFIVENCIVIELKAIERLAPIHMRQLHTYLRLTGCPLGYVMNFGSMYFVDGIRRLVNNFPHGSPPYIDLSHATPPNLAELSANPSVEP